MSTIENLTTQLEDLSKLINKALINFKKSPKVRLTPGYLKTKIECLEEYWSSFRTAHTQLLQATTYDQRTSIPYFESDGYNESEDIYINLKADITDLIQSTSAAPICLQQQQLPISGDNIVADIKLPAINLPTFSGAYEEWQPFEDLFTSLVHNNKALSEVQKLHYLKICITGEASNTIKHFQIIKNNYGPAWESLRNRYNHKRLIINAILKRFTSIRKITTTQASSLKLLIDNTKECLNGLNTIGINTDTWDPIIIFILVQKLDQETHKDWETYAGIDNKNELPSLKSFTYFIESRIRTLELTSPGLKERSYQIKERSYHTNNLDTNSITCQVCGEDHFLYHCKVFGKWEPEKRSEFTKENKLCYNCLVPGHPVFFCKQKTSCKICKRRHHSLLHSFKKREEPPEGECINATSGVSSLYTDVEENEVSTEISSHFSSNNKRALLATALVPVKDISGELILLRALIDPGSQASFISERAAQLLRLKRKQIYGKVTGVGSTRTEINHMVAMEISSNYEGNFNLKVKAYVLSSHVTSNLPSTAITPVSLPHLQTWQLADPKYFTPGKIDLLLGVEVYTEILKDNFIKGMPSAQETRLGWILFGRTNEENKHDNSVTMHHHLDLDNMLRNLWEIEETNKRTFTSEERLCEEFYETTHTRAQDGRYVVKIPVKEINLPQIIGSTRDIALRRLQTLNRKLEKNHKLKDEYTKVMKEYLDLNHMEEVPANELNDYAIYLPHHAVTREDKETTQVRIVFDASCKGSNNKSLNEQLLVGPPLQDDLRNIIMRWRMKPICFIADIEKMYRQILVSKEDTNYQRILWQPENEMVKTYRMLRVTFGLAAAPYLAIKTILQIAKDEGKNHPEAARIITEDFYVDDCISGSYTVKDAIMLSHQISNILERGGFVLQKWASNSTEFMECINPTLKRKGTYSNIGDKECIIKTLGLAWNFQTDTFEYTCKLPESPKFITKRNILADIQKLFDPLGWLGAAIIPAKILIQRLWVEKLDWDERVSGDIEEEWYRLRNEYNNLSEIKINRWIGIEYTDLSGITLHGFCDASTKAYCAVVYCRVETATGIRSGIVASKTRVAPVRPISLPRLELCGAVILARLLKQTREAMRIPTNQVYAWTDATIVLSWLFGDPRRWKPFVQNRVVEILDYTCNTQWFHVASEDNPADIGSRGCSPLQLRGDLLWWEGPSWLKHRKINFTRPYIATTELEKKEVHVNTKLEEKQQVIHFENFISLDELLKTIALCLRFLNFRKLSNNTENNLTTFDLENALKRCIKIVQKEQYKTEINTLKSGKYVSKVSHLKSLNPYIDEFQILRVGGRLRNSNLPTDLKNPIILGYNHAFIKLIVKDAHSKTHHGGLQLMLCYIRSKYWIIRAKNVIKNYINNCIICTKMASRARTQIMGDLPRIRVTPARPFLHSGVDFAGPFHVLMSRGRGAKTNKAYISIFVCMATKAIHLELVGNLTSQSFIGAFQRFIARRGMCSHIWSDQGRNFVGANKELSTAWKEAGLEFQGKISNELMSEGTQWHFIPPYSPNFGGLWEAGVKSVKFHLKRILTTNLTFEEMTTVLCQVEACLNSRPLVPIDTANPDLEILTPGHFLIGEAPVAIPNPDLRNVNVNSLTRWQFTQKLTRDFWHRWQTEYLSRLQQRPKWLKHSKELKVGDIVLIRDEILPPGKWPLGRIVEKHPGSDGVTRVYSIRCRGDIVKRSISKICLLPIDY